MAHKFTLILNREITDDEISALKDAGCVDATIDSVTPPGTDNAKVTQLDFDTEVWPSLAESIQGALDAVKTIPELSVPTLTVPPQPAEKPEVVTGEVVEPEPEPVQS